MNKTEQYEARVQDNIQIGKNIRKIRTDKNLLQKDLAEKIKVSDNTISCLERGKPHISLNRLLQLCTVLNVSLFDILADTSIVKTKIPSNYINSYAQLNDNNKEIIDIMLETMIKQQRVSKDNKYFKKDQKIEYLDVYNTTSNNNITIRNDKKTHKNNDIEELDEQYFNDIEDMYDDESDDLEIEREKFWSKYKK